MAAINVRERLVARISELNDEQVNALLTLVDVLHPIKLEDNLLPDDYDEATDPTIGFID